MQTSNVELRDLLMNNYKAFYTNLTNFKYAFHQIFILIYLYIFFFINWFFKSQFIYTKFSKFAKSFTLVFTRIKIEKVILKAGDSLISRNIGFYIQFNYFIETNFSACYWNFMENFIHQLKQLVNFRDLASTTTSS